MKIIKTIVIWLLECIVVLTGFFALMAILAIMLDNYADHETSLSRCRKQATTPYEYHRC